MDEPEPIRRASDSRVLLLLAVGTLIFLILTGVSSPLPDGLEAAAEWIGHHGSEPVGGVVLSDWVLYEWLAGLIGAAVTGVLLWLYCRRCPGPKEEGSV